MKWNNQLSRGAAAASKMQAGRAGIFNAIANELRGRLGWWSRRAALAALMLAGCLGVMGAQAASYNLVQTFILPEPEPDIHTSLSTIDSTGTAEGNTMLVTIAIIVPYTNTVIVYDQHEDGYELNLSSPVQTTTKIWGDGNQNTPCPGYPSNFLPAGAVILLTNTVTLPLNPSVFAYDGKDQIGATKPVQVTRAAWGLTPGTVLTSASSVEDTSRWGTNFVMPVGTNVNFAIQNFSYSAAYIMAEANPTVVYVNTGNGIIQTNTLSQGQNWVVTNMEAGGTVKSSLPVQVHEVTGRIGSTYQSRTFDIRPFNQWGSSYHAAAGTTLSSEVHNVFVYNPYSTNITVYYQTANGSGSFVVTNGGNDYKFPMPLNTGANFFTTNGTIFYAVGCDDSGAATSANQTHDWGYSLLPDAALTTVAICGWSPGSDFTQPPPVNGSPVWVAPLQATTIYVNYSGNTNVGRLTAANGWKYDTNYTVSALEYARVYNPTNNLTGARVFTIDGTLFTAVWGEDPSVAGPANPYIDAGLAVLPFPSPTITKSYVLSTDADNNGVPSVGDTLEYTITVINNNTQPTADIGVVDTLPAGLTYVAGSTTLNGVALADNTVPPSLTAFPLDEGGVTVPDLAVGASDVLTYKVKISATGSFTNFATGTQPGLWSQTVSSVVYATTNGTPTPVCVLGFTDGSGNAVSSYAPNSGLYVTMTNTAFNLSPAVVDTVLAVVTNSADGDYEVITLTETSANSGVFRNTTALPSSVTAGVLPLDGTLNAGPGDSIQALVPGSTCGSATVTISTPSLSKILYLDNGQTLDRYNPVALGDTTAANTVVLGGASGTGSVTVDSTTSGTTGTSGDNSITIAHTTSGNNRLMLVGVSLQYDNSVGSQDTVSSVTYHGKNLTLLKATESTVSSGMRARSETWYMLAPDTGNNNVVITTSQSYGIVAGVTTFTGVDQTTPIITADTTSANSGTSTSATSASLTSTAVSGYQVFATLAIASTTSSGSWPGTITPGGTPTSLWNNLKINNLSTYQVAGAGSTTTAAGTSVTSSWSWVSGSAYALTAVTIKPSAGTTISGTSFTQAPEFTNTFSLPSGGLVYVTNYISNITGTIPANPTVTAALSYSNSTGTTRIITLTNPTYNSTAGTLVWSGTLASDFSIPAGSFTILGVTNTSTTYTFQVNYGATTVASAVALPTTTVINLSSLVLSSTGYPTVTPVNSILAGQPLYIQATVTDPFGAYDVNHLVLAITDPSANVTSVTLTNVNIVATNGYSVTYQYAWTAPGTVGNYTINANAFEGTEGITNSAAAGVYVFKQDLGVPTTITFTSGNDGTPTNSYPANPTSICVLLNDQNDAGPTAGAPIVATITTSTGDTEPITLYQTAANSGLFANCITANTGTVVTNNGVLNVANGGYVNVTFTDTNNAAYSSTAAATILPTSSGTTSVSVLKTLISPAGGTTPTNGTAQFNIQVVNTGNNPLTTVTVVDVFNNAQLLFTAASATPDTNAAYAPNGTKLSWANVGPLASGASTNITVSFTVLATGTLTNSAAVSGTAAAGPSLASLTGSSVALAVNKWIVSPVPGPAGISNQVVYVVGLTNIGTVAITNLPLEDQYSGGQLQFVSSTKPPAGAGGGQILWTNLGPLAAGGYVNVTNTFVAIGIATPAVNSAVVDYAVATGGVAVPPVQSSTNINIVGASILGTLYYDANASGTNDSSDSTLSGVTLFIDYNGTGIYNPTNDPVAVTDANGNYSFSSLAAGSYHVVVETNTLPAGMTPTFNANGANPVKYLTSNLTNTIVATVTSGQVLTNQNFGYTGTGSIGQYVWYDVNGDGIDQANEPPLAGVGLFIDYYGTGTWEPGEPYTTTSASGYYIFTNLPAGTYDVTVDYTTLPAGSVNTANIYENNTILDGVASVNLAAGQNVTNANFGFQGDASIAGTLKLDVNGNGTADTADTNGIAGVPVILETSAGVPVATNVTTSTGAYQFPGLQPGTYKVVQIVPAGYTNTTATTLSVTVVDGQTSTGNNYLDTQYGTIGQFAWVDKNGDGLTNNSEPGLQGVTVVLYMTNVVTHVQTPVATNTTTSSGGYVFTNVVPSTNLYVVGFTLPSGYSYTTPLVGSNTNINSAVVVTNGVNGLTAGIIINSGTTNLAENAGAYQATSLAGSVLVDVNGNGQYDTADTQGIASVTVDLYSGSTLVAQTTTAANGSYSFPNLAPGTYSVVQIVPPGYTNTTSTNLSVTLTSGVPSTGNNYLDTHYGTIGQFAWVDNNGDGLTNNSEPGLPGVTVVLYETNSVTHVLTPVATNTTASSGGYLFTNVLPSTNVYVVGFSVPTGYVYTKSNAGTGSSTNLDSAVVVTNGVNGLTAGITINSATTNLAQNAGVYQVASLAGTLKLDVNGNGIADAADTQGIAGVTIDLYSGSTLVTQTTTAANGSYSFANLAPGSYTVVQVVPPGYTNTTPVTLPVTLASGQSSTGNNYLDTQYGTIGQFAWIDNNGDGLTNNSEPGLPGVAVTLYETNSVTHSLTAVATTTTASSGGYVFTNVLPSTNLYVVGFTLPTGYVYTTPLVGSNTNLNSAVVVTNGVNGLTAGITINSGTTNLSENAGAYQVASLAGNLKLDVNGNGVADTADTNGIAGVTIDLYSGSTLLAAATTAADGSYSFANLAPGSYTVVQVVPPGYTNTTPVTLPVTLAGGQSSTGNNYLDTQFGTIGQFAWVDNNGDGLTNNSEPGLPGVTVVLYETNSVTHVLTPVATNTTPSSGGYLFTNVLPSTNVYVVGFSVPTGYVYTSANAGTGSNTNLASAVVVTNGVNGLTAGFTINSGTTNLSENAGAYQVASLAGNLKLDMNGNGVADTADTNGIAGVTIDLYSGSTLLAAATTAADGSYSFANLAPGSYTVVQVVPPGYTNTTPVTLPVTLVSGQSSTGNNYLDTQYGTIGQFAWVDNNGDGLTNNSEPGLPGVAVTLYETNSATHNLTAVATTTTAANGAYLFTNVLPSTNLYVVGFTLPTGYVYTTPLVGSNTNLNSAVVVTNGVNGLTAGITINSGTTNLSENAGAYQVASLAGTLKVDVNGNGVADLTDTQGIAGVTIDLYSGSTLLTSTLTAVDGSYSFANLAPGSYTVVQVVPPGYTNTTPVTLPVTLAGGQSSTGNNYLDTQFGTIGQFAWIDNNGDGLTNNSEPGLPGVAVTLYETNSVTHSLTTVATTTTASSGGYLFTNVVPSTNVYVVGFILPGGYSYTTPLVGSNTNINSAVVVTNGASGLTAGFTINSGTTNLAENAGAYQAATIAGSVLLDVNGNGQFDTADTNGITPVAIDLYSGGTLLTSATTAANGSYSFANLAPGTYTVVQVVPAGYTNTTSTNLTVTLVGGTPSVGNNYLDTQPGSLNGTVFVDYDNNGIEDGADYGITNVTVTLTGTNGLGSAISYVVQTLADGTYAFTNVLPGTNYVITETPPAGYGQGTNALGSLGGSNPVPDVFSNLVLTAGQTGTGYNYGQTVGSIGNYVWLDVNGNGIFEASEQGLAGVTVFLDLNNDGNLDPGDPSAVTDANGYYLITNLLSGTYTVAVLTSTLPAGVVQTYSLVGGTNAPQESVPVTLSAGDTFLDANFGYRYPAPTLATLAAGSFEGVASSGGVQLGWTTLSEADCAYFSVNRLVAGEWVNEVPFVLALDSAIGGNYAATDDTVTAPGTYEYQLVEVDLDGSRVVLGTCTVVVPAAGPITVTLEREAGNVRVSWTGGTPPYHLEEIRDLAAPAGVQPALNTVPPTGWVEVPLTDSTTKTVLLPATGPAGFFRVYGAQP